MGQKVFILLSIHFYVCKIDKTLLYFIKILIGVNC